MLEGDSPVDESLIDAVSDAIREVGRAEVLPRFRALAAGDIAEKSPGDFVTIADQECERALAARLRAIRDVPIVGEEAAEDDPSLVQALAGADAAWVVDPIDGTSNFIAGSPDFAVMVGLVEQGRPTAAWIWYPVADRLVSATKGAGVRDDDGRSLSIAPVESSPAGVAKVKYVPAALRERVAAAVDGLPRAADRRCAGYEYLDLVEGRSSFLFYWRTKPWDHVPGGLIAAEAGLTVARLDGSPYRPGDDRRGLLSARPERWADLATTLRLALDD